MQAGLDVLVYSVSVADPDHDEMVRQDDAQGYVAHPLRPFGWSIMDQLVNKMLVRVDPCVDSQFCRVGLGP